MKMKIALSLNSIFCSILNKNVTRHFNKNLSNKNNFDELLNLINKAESSKNEINTNQKMHKNEHFIRVIGNGNMKSPKSFILHSAGERFLFNCGESTSRILLEMQEIKGKATNINILLTRSSWNQCFSGVFSLIHTFIKYCECSTICFHSPFHDVNKFIYDTYHLLKLSSIRFEQHDYKTSKNIFFKNNIQVKCLPFSTSHGYLLTLNHSECDRFNRACDHFGVPIDKRILLKKQRYLTVGKKTVRVEDLLKFFNISPINQEDLFDFYKILVIDISNKSDLKKFILENFENLNNIDLVVHMSSNKILNDKTYIDYFKRISVKYTQHIFLDETSPNLASNEIYLRQLRYNQLNEFVFPALPLQISTAGSQRLTI